MPIRRVHQPDEPLALHRLVVDPVTHPRLHALLREMPIGKPRVDFLRDQMEALLAAWPEGLSREGVERPQAKAPVQKAGSVELATVTSELPAATPDAAPPEYVVPAAVATPVARIESAEDKAARLAAADSLFSFQSDL
jgi:hypothetical protein